MQIHGKGVEGDTKVFAQLVVGLVEDRAKLQRLAMEDNKLGVPVGSGGSGGAGSGGVGRSVGAGSLDTSGMANWENERAELMVDIPVWNPGCFQDLSTLHQLRDTTLSHTHAILTHLLANHSIPATYRLLARSGPSSNSSQAGWGCIRLAAPSPRSSQTAPSSLACSPTHHRRRTSFVKPLRRLSNEVRLSHEHVILDGSDDENEEGDLKGGRGGKERLVILKEGYVSGSSDSEDDEDSADVLVSREIEKRGLKEGAAFLMTLHGQPALILI